MKKDRQPSEVEPRTPLAWATSALHATELRQPDSRQPSQSSICTAHFSLSSIFASIPFPVWGKMLWAAVWMNYIFTLSFRQQAKWIMWQYIICHTYGGTQPLWLYVYCSQWNWRVELNIPSHFAILDWEVTSAMKEAASREGKAGWHLQSWWSCGMISLIQSLLLYTYCVHNWPPPMEILQLTVHCGWSLECCYVNHHCLVLDTFHTQNWIRSSHTSPFPLTYLV